MNKKLFEDQANVVQDEAQITLHEGSKVVAHRSGGSALSVETAQDLDGDSIQSSLRGRPSRGEAGTMRAAQLLRRKLNTADGSWSLFDCSDSVSDVDVEFRDVQGNVLRVQHTRVAGEKLLGQLARTRSVEGATDSWALADELLVSIRKKADVLPSAQRRALVLLLDAVETPAFSLEPVVRRFREKHMDQVRALDFHAVWLVGPMNEFVHRLDR